MLNDFSLHGEKQMAQAHESRNTFFNFRIKRTEMIKLRQAAKDFGYLSFAEFIRTAIRDLIWKETERKNGK